MYVLCVYVFYASGVKTRLYVYAMCLCMWQTSFKYIFFLNVFSSFLPVCEGGFGGGRWRQQTARILLLHWGPVRVVALAWRAPSPTWTRAESQKCFAYDTFLLLACVSIRVCARACVRASASTWTRAESQKCFAYVTFLFAYVCAQVCVVLDQYMLSPWHDVPLRPLEHVLNPKNASRMFFCFF